MQASATTAAEREPRRARYLIPKDTPRRAEIVACLAVLWLLAHLLLAQLTLVLAVVFHLTSRVTRWRPAWLAVPASAGLICVLAVGPAAALTAFTAGPGRVLSYIAGSPGDPARVFHLTAAYAGIGHWLPGQAAIALIAACGEAAAAWWLGWLHGGQPASGEYRPGLIVLARGEFNAWCVEGGGVVSREGVTLGIDSESGKRAGISWQEAEGGVLCTGAAQAMASTASFQLVHAAIRRRKPVIAVDMAGTPGLAESLAAVCAGAGASLRVFGPAGQGCYEPLRGGEPGRKASLLMGMIDWSSVSDHARRACQGYLNDLFAVAAAAPGDPRQPVLDDVAHLLSPAALRARVERVPAYHPRRAPLVERVRMSATLLDADPGSARFLAEELTRLRSSTLGRWLRPHPDSGRISLAEVVRERGVAFFPLDQAVHGRQAAMIGNLVALDIAAVYAESRRLEVEGDGLAWFGQCEALAPDVVARLVAVGSKAGLGSVLATSSAEAAGRFAGLARVRLDLTGATFSLNVREPGPRIVGRGRFVPGAVR
ncbi:MAG TPA: hypothetical protein VG253_05110 [Streptosporangiaceae bacterium]|nr:hypothetical protein [Streptosporangiaceae bacterium]